MPFNTLDEWFPKMKIRTPGEYGNFEIMSSEDFYWWKDWVGQILFCRINKTIQGEITSVFPCRLLNSKIEIGRGIPIEFVELR